MNIIAAPHLLNGSAKVDQASNLRRLVAQTSPEEQHKQLEKQAQIWVGQTFFGTLLKQMRESPFRSELFDGGRGGQAFGSMYDQHLAEHMARGAGKKLVKAIVKKIEAKQADAKSKRGQDEYTGSSDVATTR